MISVKIADQQNAFPIDRNWYRGLARHALAAESVENAELSLAFVDNATIHRLNRQFLEHDYPTDVLTFPLAGGKKLVGEIVLSTEFAVEESVAAGWSPQVEAGLYVVHGILHLCGYNDNDDDDAEKMRQRQEDLLGEYVSQQPVATADAVVRQTEPAG